MGKQKGTIMEAKEYLKSYKEKVLAEMCEKKDEEIDRLANNYNDLLKKYDDAKIYQDAFKSPRRIVDEIETLSVSDFLDVYHRLQNKVNNSYTSSCLSIGSNGITANYCK